MNVKFITVTPDAERHMAFCARVSGDQSKEDYKQLFSYCLRKGHWSVFESAYMTVEVTTSLAIATQILRHRSFTFQQLSRRYSDSRPTFEMVGARRQGKGNRQGSTDDLDDKDLQWFDVALNTLEQEALYLYTKAIERGIANESARFFLPQSTQTTLYVTGNVRSWIHYLQSRLAPEAQGEHRLVANEILSIFTKEFPTVTSIIDKMIRGREQ